jgi:methyl-accepting chemotaxis protein
MTLGVRLGLGFTATLALLVGITVLGLVQMRQQQQLQAAVDATNDQLSLAQQWRGQTQVNLARALSLAKADNNPQLDAYLAPQMKATSAEISKLQKQLTDSTLSSSGRQALEAIGGARENYLGTRKKVLALLKAGDASAAAEVDRSLLPAADAYLASMTHLEEVLNREVTQAQHDGAASAANARQLMIGMAVLALGMGAWIAWALTRSITRPMLHAIGTAEAIAEGNLTVDLTVDREDEIGRLQRAMQRMRGSLHEMVAGIRQSTDGISTASSEVASGSMDLSHRTEQAASNLQRTASSMEQLSGTVRQTADAAQTANQLAHTASDTAKGGRGGAGGGPEHAEDLRGQPTHRRHHRRDRRHRLPDQHPGPERRGGSRPRRGAGPRLRRGGRRGAQPGRRSAEAAREIKQLIHTSVERVESGSALVDSAGRSMAEIVQSVQRVTDIIAEITAATGEQSAGISEVGQAVNQLDEMTQQNAALVEESNAAAESLKDQAQQLGEIVSRFRLDQHSGAGHAIH